MDMGLYTRAGRFSFTLDAYKYTPGTGSLSYSAKFPSRAAMSHIPSP